MKTFSKSFLQQEPLPDSAIDLVGELMRTGRLHRYDMTVEDPGQTALLEQEFAAWQNARYCLACASCGYALYVAMVAAGVGHGDVVLCNAFTLAPVPGAIDNCGATACLVETSEDLTIDLDDLERKAAGADFLLLSHMRGHLPDMDRVMEICGHHSITVIEDCAHSLGAWWGDRRSGSFGDVSCFSTQTYKHLNSGEGGLLVTDNPEIIRKAILLSGSYRMYDKHLAAPPPESFESIASNTPNYSGRMDNLRAAALRPQLELLNNNIERWNQRYNVLADGLRQIPGVVLPQRPQKEHYVGSSIQFFLPGLDTESIEDVVTTAANRGVQLKYFGAEQPHGYTSRFDSWTFLETEQKLPQTLSLLMHLLDMRVPLTFELDDCRLIVEILDEILSGR